MSANSDCVNVVVRVRPPLANERRQPLRVAVHNESVLLSKARRDVFGRPVRSVHEFDSYDRVYGGSHQWQIYEDIGAPVVNATVHDGINCCVFAFGQTGSGKTFTMLGEDLEDDIRKAVRSSSSSSSASSSSESDDLVTSSEEESVPPSDSEEEEEEGEEDDVTRRTTFAQARNVSLAGVYYDDADATANPTAPAPPIYAPALHPRPRRRRGRGRGRRRGRGRTGDLEGRPLARRTRRRPRTLPQQAQDPGMQQQQHFPAPNVIVLDQTPPAPTPAPRQRRRRIRRRRPRPLLPTSTSPSIPPPPLVSTEVHSRPRFTIDALFEHYRPLFHIFPVELIALIHSFMPDSMDISKRGLIPRVCKNIFKELRSEHGEYFDVRVRFVEIYNEMTRDLLTRRKTKFQRNTLSDNQSNGGVNVAGAPPIAVHSYSDVLKHLRFGLRRRVTKATKGNKVSSRSHAIFTLFIRTYREENRRIYKDRRLHLVDLAGSEKYGKKNYQQDRQTEGCFINKSLLELGRCLGIAMENSTSKNQRVRKRNFVPYRSSLLTHILKDSMGGLSKTYMICNVSPCRKDVDESFSTLEYARRCKAIRLNVRKNAENDWAVKLRNMLDIACKYYMRRDELEAKIERMRRFSLRHPERAIVIERTIEFAELQEVLRNITRTIQRSCGFMDKKLNRFEKSVVNSALVDSLQRVACQYDHDEIMNVVMAIRTRYDGGFWDLHVVEDLLGM